MAGEMPEPRPSAGSYSTHLRACSGAPIFAYSAPAPAALT